MLRFILPVCFVVASLAVRADDSTAPKTPATILLIRHAEKLPDDKEASGLSPKGEERAKLLHRLFERPDPFPKPDFVFAAKFSKTSHRSKLTVEPLAQSLALPIDDRYSKDDSEKLAKELLSNSKYAGKTVLVCWQHGTLPQLAKSLGAADAPPEWPDSKFDRVWRLDFGPAGKPRFRIVPQKLMAGDSAK